jgi:hypothetical protein
MEGSSEERQISFFPLRVDVMALAVGPDRSLAWSLAERGKGLNPGPPASPIWIRFEPQALREAGASEPLRVLLGLMEGAEEVQLEVTKSASGYQGLLEAECRSPETATWMASQLTAATRALGALSAGEGKASGQTTVGEMLAQGVFEARGSRVFGRWPISQAFVEGILGISR